MGSMSDKTTLIGQMVSDLSTQAFQLEEQRLCLFLHWLMDHSSEMKESLGSLDSGIGNVVFRELFMSALKTWLQSLPEQGLLWEYRTITAEIAWWHDLDQARLQMIFQSEGQA